MLFGLAKILSIMLCILVKTAFQVAQFSPNKD